MRPVAETWLPAMLLVGLLSGAVSAQGTTAGTGPDTAAAATTVDEPVVDQSGQAPPDDPFEDLSPTLKVVLLLTALTVLPAALMTVTSFTRIIIVLGFVRRALSVQEVPPNQVMIGLALFLSVVVMSPTLARINDQALQPYLSEDPAVHVGLGQAADISADELKSFLLEQTREDDILVMLEVTSADKPDTPAEVPLHILIPAFALSELRVAFQMGFLIYLPFLIVDLVVASILLSMGMFMLPPVIISTPFKVLLFVLVDGWDLIVKSLVNSFAA